MPRRLPRRSSTNSAGDDEFDVVAARRRLLTWFQRQARDLPWRRDRDPYRIWISEVMLQQTQVVTVIPYFQRFLERFPNVTELAAAPLNDVLRLWEGLGYYRRARDLHRAAQILVAHNGGVFPRAVEQIADLPGFGRYTTNAVASQAFDIRLPILEANSTRLLARLFALQEDPKAAAVQKRLWAWSESLLPKKRVGDFNQAMMELGSLVCTPREPKCPACPLSKQCQAYRQGLVNVIPKRAAKSRMEETREVAVVVYRGNEVLLVQRPDRGRWAGMWEFPRTALLDDQTHQQAARELSRELGLDIHFTGEIATVRHGVTRFRITLVCLEAEHRRGRFRRGLYQAARWMLPSYLTDYPVSSPQRRLADEVHRRSEIGATCDEKRAMDRDHGRS